MIHSWSHFELAEARVELVSMFRTWPLSDLGHSTFDGRRWTQHKKGRLWWIFIFCGSCLWKFWRTQQRRDEYKDEAAEWLTTHLPWCCQSEERATTAASGWKERGSKTRARPVLHLLKFPQSLLVSFDLSFDAELVSCVPDSMSRLWRGKGMMEE